MKNKIYTLLFVCFLIKVQLGFSQNSWVPLGVGINSLNPNSNSIGALISDYSGNVYATGNFTDSTLSNLGHRYVAKWDGSNWSELGVGSYKLNPNSSSVTLTTDKQNNIYTAGNFTDSTTMFLGHCYVADWNGLNWSKLGVGANALNPNSYINIIATDKNNNVYAVGNFTDSLLANKGHRYIAKWDGNSWSALGVGNNALSPNGNISSMITDTAGNVFVAGTFTDSATSNQGMNYIAKWDGNHWSSVGKFSAYISDLTFDSKGNLYAVGAFTDSGKIAGINHGSYYIGKWDGNNWSKLATHSWFMRYISTNIQRRKCITDKYGRIYISGNFSTGSGYYAVMEYDFSTDTLTPIFHPNQIIYDLAKDKLESTLYASGAFTDSTSFLKGHAYVAQYKIAESGNMPNGINYLNNREEQMLVYPNPTTSVLTIYKEQIAIKTIVVSDLLGQIVNCKLTVDTPTNYCQLNTENLPSGIYFIKATDAQGNISNAKFLKE